MKKKILVIIFALFFVISLTGCGNSNSNKSSSTEKTESKSKGNCDVFTCLEKLDTDMSLEEMNKIIGFEGKLESDEEKYKTYSWDLTDDTSITSQFMTSYNTATISANYPTSMVEKKADFSKWEDIKSRLNKKEKISYDEFVKLVGGVKGAIKQKNSSSTSYSWYNSDGGYLTAYFNKDGICTMATGRF